MKILDFLISTLDIQVPVRDVRMGLFHTGVVTRNCGLAATLPKDALRQEPPLIREPGSLKEKEAIDLVRMAYSDRILEAVIGMAAINSLMEVDKDSCIELNAGDLIMEKGKGKRVAIVGHFPFINKVRKVAKELWVIEKNPREGDYDEHAASTLIPQADVVGITGTAFTNHTIENLLTLCNTKAYIIILGDTTPLAPILFDFGIDALSGTIVTDNETALRCISEGSNYRQIKGIKKLIMVNK